MIIHGNTNSPLRPMVLTGTQTGRSSATAVNIANAMQRQVGKARALGAMYGSGPPAYPTTADLRAVSAMLNKPKSFTNPRSWYHDNAEARYPGKLATPCPHGPRCDKCDAVPY